MDMDGHTAVKDQSRFRVADYGVFAAMLIVSAGIGVYHRLTSGRHRTIDEYLLANRKMGVWPVAFSLVASFMSAITVLGYASENYVHGTQFVALNLAYVIGVPIVAYVYLPVFFRVGATSAYEYLERRFGLSTRLIASVTFQIQMVLYMGIVLYAPALALSAVTGLSKWTSILSLGVVCTFYSTIGGMKTILYTDVFQSILMFSAVSIVLIKGCLDAGSLTNVLRAVSSRLEFFKMDVDPTVRHTLWTQVFGGIFTYTAIYGVNQAQVQRLLTIGKLKNSQKSLLLSWPILTLLNLLTSACGIIIYYHYRNCDPLAAGRISSSDQLMPLFIMDFVSEYPGIAGLFVSGVFSATLSTISSAVNSLAAVTLEDYLKPRLGSQWSNTKQACVSQILVVFYGSICLTMTYVAEQLGGVLQASLTVFGVVGGPTLGIFSLGMFTTRANQKGAIFGLVTSLLFISWIGFGASATGVRHPGLPVRTSGCNGTFGTSMWHNGSWNSTFETGKVSQINNDHIWYLYRLSYMWLAPLGFGMAFLFGYLVSIATGGSGNRSLDPMLISPPFQKLYGLQLKDRNSNSQKVKQHCYENDLSHQTLVADQSLECVTRF